MYLELHFFYYTIDNELNILYLKLEMFLILEYLHVHSEIQV